MTEKRLTPEQVTHMILETPEWFADETSSAIARTWIFDDFQTAILFVNKVAGIAEKENHHPNIHVHNYNQVTISVTTHSVAGLTERDFSLAGNIDNILQK